MHALLLNVLLLNCVQWLVVGSIDVSRRSLAAEMFTQKNKISLAEILHCNLHNNSYASNKNLLTEICTTIWRLQFLRKHSNTRLQFGDVGVQIVVGDWNLEAFGQIAVAG